MVGCIKRELWLTLNQSILSEAAKIKEKKIYRQEIDD